VQRVGLLSHARIFFSDCQKNRHTQHAKVWREKRPASRVLAALASPPATKALDPDPFPATHSAMPSMLPCCTSDLNRRSIIITGPHHDEFALQERLRPGWTGARLPAFVMPGSGLVSISLPP
jgi:hypothetical protein